jgi:hypothetical protein
MSDLTPEEEAQIQTLLEWVGFQLRRSYEKEIYESNLTPRARLGIALRDSDDSGQHHHTRKGIEESVALPEKGTDREGAN